MCRKAKCAYLRETGYCLMHRTECNVLHPDARCRDGVTRAVPSRERPFWNYLGEWNMKTAKGRFSFLTRNARGHTVYRTCSRKRRFKSLYEAMAKIRELKQRKGWILSSYECPFCGGYHLTHRRCHESSVLNGIKDVGNCITETGLDGSLMVMAEMPECTYS